MTLKFGGLEQSRELHDLLARSCAGFTPARFEQHCNRDNWLKRWSRRLHRNDYVERQDSCRPACVALSDSRFNPDRR
jgi:hypothetical protein